MANDLLDAGFKIINASWKPLYHVTDPNTCWSPKEILNWDVYTWDHWVSYSPAYLNPIRVVPTDDVLGAQFCFWGLTYEQAISYILVKGAALSERLWNVKRLDEDETCLSRIGIISRLTSMLIQDV